MLTVEAKLFRWRHGAIGVRREAKVAREGTPQKSPLAVRA
jgi:hypothetical protein